MKGSRDASATLEKLIKTNHSQAVRLDAIVYYFTNEPIRVYELKAALDQARRRSAPGADRITFQMLRNLADAEKERLLECFNTIWGTGFLPESWLVAAVTPILKSRKPAIALSSYRPVSLTSAACKAMERVALARLEWIAAQLQYFPEQQSGFRCQRCTADSISDVVATLEDAKATGDVAMLVLLDVKSAFNGLPHAVIEACLDHLGLSGCLRCFISAFLTSRTFRVRVGQELSEPRDITTGVPQEAALSSFLFNMALAGLPASRPADPRFPVRCSIYADDVAPWTRGPRKFMPSIRCSLQRALDAVTAFLGSIGLTVSTAKTEAMLIHPLASARRYTKQLKIAGRALPWQQMAEVAVWTSAWFLAEVSQLAQNRRCDKRERRPNLSLVAAARKSHACGR
ncbi:hypothetical protein HPB49_000527 [Dermacentor silvarum]|uniref:Uncharacterized protein n=1 Tax=Dermacentor silvarum TaxID=543639 RepID=A0ACB8C101_DERSI|nr:hypothetical protein HPB49_000527 [Dermacentor silvarum]